MRQGRYFLVGNFMWRGSYFFLRGIVCAQECDGKAISSGTRSTEPASVSNHKGGLLKWSTNEYNCFKTWANVGVDCPNWELVRDVERGEVFDASSLKGEIADLRKTLKKC